MPFFHELLSFFIGIVYADFVGCYARRFEGWRISAATEHNADTDESDRLFGPVFALLLLQFAEVNNFMKLKISSIELGVTFG